MRSDPAKSIRFKVPNVLTPDALLVPLISIMKMECERDDLSLDLVAAVLLLLLTCSRIEFA